MGKLPMAMRWLRRLWPLALLLLVPLMSRDSSDPGVRRYVGSVQSLAEAPASLPSPGRSEGAMASAAERTLLGHLSQPIVPTSGAGPARFVLRDRNASVFFTDQGMRFALSSMTGGWGLDWNLVGAAAVRPMPRGESSARIHDFVGKDPTQWKANLPSYAEIVYPQARPGVDVVMESRPHAVEYSLHVEPAAVSDRFRLRYEGAQQVRVVNGGTALEIRTRNGMLREDGLLCFQIDDGGRKQPISARYAAVSRTGPSAWEYEIALADVRPDRALVIDPTISWSTYLGGFIGGIESIDYGNAVALDGAGNTYVVGRTWCVDFPTLGALDSILGAQESDNPYDGVGGGSSDAFVAKFNPSGSLAWSSYLGGSSEAAPTISRSTRCGSPARRM